MMYCHDKRSAVVFAKWTGLGVGEFSTNFSSEIRLIVWYGITRYPYNGMVKS